MALFLPAIAAIGAIGSWITARKVQDYLDPYDPGKYEGRARANAQVLARLDGGEGYYGIQQTIAHRTIGGLPGSMKLDFIRSEKTPEELEYALRTVIDAEVEKWHANPGDLGYGDIFLAPFRSGSGVSLSSFGMLMDSGKRAMDAAVSNAKGEGTTVGRAAAEQLGLEDGSFGHKILSGTFDAAALLAGDPLIVGGKAVKGFRAAHGAGRAALDRKAIDFVLSRRRVTKWAEEMVDLRSPSEVQRWATFGGSSMEAPTAMRIAAASSRDDVLEALRQGLFTGDLPHLPIWPWLGKGTEKVWSMAHNMPVVRLGQRVWDAEVNLQKVEAMDDFRRHADYLFGGATIKEVMEEMGTKGALTKGDERIMKSFGFDAGPAGESLGMKASDFWADKMMRADPLTRLQLYQTFQTKAVRFWGKRTFGATDSQIDEAMHKLQLNGRGLEDMATRQFHNASKLNPHQRVYESQLPYMLQTMSYDDYISLAAELTPKRISKMSRKAYIQFNTKLERALSPVKRLWLANFRYPLRNGLEEFLGMMAHPKYGPEYRSVIMDRMAGRIGQVPVIGAPVRRSGWKMGRMRSNVPEVEEFVEEMAQRAVTEMPGYIQSNKLLRHYIDQNIGAVPKEVERALKRDHMWAGMTWSVVNKENAGYRLAHFHVVNQQMLRDRLTKLMLSEWDNPNKVNVAREWLGSTEGKDYLRRFAEAWGDDVDEVISTHLQLIEKNLPGKLLSLARRGEVSMDEISRHMADLPNITWGPVALAETATGHKAIKAQAKLFAKHGGFFGWAGDVVDAVGRVPGYEAAVRTELRRLRTMALENGAKVADEDLLVAAKKHAERFILRHADTPLNRTRADMLVGGMIPFFDAQVRFWKRWGRIAATNPGYVEKTRLLMTAGESTGWLEEDDYGNLVGKIPVASQLFSAISGRFVGADVAGDWFKFTFDQKRQEELGLKGDIGQAGRLILPRGVPFWGDVFPGFSPLITFPVDFLTLNRPAFDTVRENILGASSFRADKVDTRKDFIGNMVAHVQVGWVDKIFKAFNGANTRDADFLGAWADAMSYLAYKRSTDDKIWAPKDDAELQDFIDEAGDMARKMWMIRGSLQAFVPWNPTKMPFGGAIAEKWHEYRNEFGPEEGLVKFLDEFGEKAFAFTVRKSKHEQGAAIAASPEAEEFYDNNPQFFRRFPEVAGFFTREMEGEFDPDFYKQQLLEGKREAIPPHDWWADVMYLSGNRKYYDEIVPQYERLEMAGADRQYLSQWLREQRAQIEVEYPGWGMGYAQWALRAEQRNQTLNELRSAVLDETVNETKGAKAIKQFIDVYDAAMRQANVMGFTTLKSEQMAPTRAWLRSQAQQLLRSGGPNFEAVYSYLWQRELEDVE